MHAANLELRRLFLRRRVARLDEVRGRPAEGGGGAAVEVGVVCVGRQSAGDEVEDESTR